MKRPLSKLQKVDLRNVWGHEAIDFTNWLAQTENLDHLSEEIGIEIKLIQTEANVGRFSVDILAEEEISERKIIIENQLENTNHDHLGKIITYASGLDAKIIIWIVRDCREEHQKAIDWLNEHTDEQIAFFLIKVELWQIENSNPAPKFEIIASPNEWAKAIKTATSGELSDMRIQQLEFWKRLKDFIRSKDTKIRLQAPQPQNWYAVTMGSSEANIALTINARENLLGCSFYINKNKELFNFLGKRKNEIEKELGEKAEWKDAAVASLVKVSNEVSGIFDQKKQEVCFAWMYEKTILFQRVFGKYLKEFKSQNNE